MTALRRAGLKPGAGPQVEAVATRRIVLTRIADVTARHAGRLTGGYRRHSLRKLRRERR